MRKIQVSITAVAAVLAIGHVFLPVVTLDAITLTLLGVAVLPWVAPLFKSVELPGGLKVEFQDLEEATRKAESVGLVKPPPPGGPERLVQLVTDDPNLALAGVRIEIERRLKRIAEEHGLDRQPRHPQGIRGLMRSLSAKGLIRDDEFVVLEDLIELLNAAVHGADVDPRASEWAIEVGTGIIRSLDERITPTGA